MDRVERLKIVQAIETALTNEIQLRMSDNAITITLTAEIDVQVTHGKAGYGIVVLRNDEIYETTTVVKDVGEIIPIIRKLYAKYYHFKTKFEMRKDYKSRLPKSRSVSTHSEECEESYVN